LTASKKYFRIVTRGIIMAEGESIVITVYGHDNEIDKIAVTTYGPNSESKADTYCHTINNLKLEGNSWVYAKIISEGVQISLAELIPMKFDIILKLPDRSFQKVLREVDSQELVRALKGASEAVQEKVFSNMTKRAELLLKEDMEYMGPVRIQDIRKAQESILDIIRQLESSGEIVIPYSKGDVVE
jgi:flagellar motor switch protein FliG